MKNITVKNVIIGKQYESSENYQEFLKIVNDKKINVYVVQKGKRVNIEKGIYIDILWPSEKDMIVDNWINNNSLVFKLVYKDFSIMFTGDIEEEAEKAILEQYSNNINKLQANVLKIAHHGSKTSTTEDFLKTVSPKIALIGVGKNNNFGHPNEQVIERLKKNGVKVYRTDTDGEISILWIKMYKFHYFVNTKKQWR